MKIKSLVAAMVGCVYKHCTNTRLKNADISFFKIPVGDKKRCAEWLINSGNPGLLQLNAKELSAKVICEKHFGESAYKDKNAVRKKLNHDAVPAKCRTRIKPPGSNNSKPIKEKEKEKDKEKDPAAPKEMPKKKLDVSAPSPRARRQASKEALKQMHRISSSAYDEPETYEILSDDEDVIPVVEPPKKKYKVTHRKSSDGNDRDVLVLRTINWGEQTLNLDAWVEDLSPAQMEMRKKQQQEYDDMTAKLTKYLADNTCEIVYESDFCTAYEVDQQQSASFVYTQQPQAQVAAKTNGTPGPYQLVMDPRSGVVVGTVTPTATPIPAVPGNKNTQRKRGRPSGGTSTLPPPAKVAKVGSSASAPVLQVRPTEATAVGGLSAGKKQSPAVVDLTADDGSGATTGNSKHAADSREIAFNKLQGKTYPSLVVVARPHLCVKEGGNMDRVILDSKVKGVLMHVPTKFTEWLIQQGLIRSEQSCTAHTSIKLKLGMYGDVSKFPLSGGYVWISECCPHRFVSVFSGSLFEGSPHPPSVILKLIYHWCCQTNVQNVIQWVKVDNLFVKGLYTWLRAICSVALHTHMAPLGGAGSRVEIGVISLGTTSQDGAQRVVKVEVLGILETDTKHIRLRAVEPVVDGDKNFKKRFAKILEPLATWVHPDSTIVTDLTVDRNTLAGMGFKNVQQVASDPNGNHTIMDYLRRIVPRMFQNTLALLSRQIIQQFLDELVWREWYGTSAALAFDNLATHVSEQTRADTGNSLIVRLNRVAANPFKNWAVRMPGAPRVKAAAHLQEQTAASLPDKRPARQRKVPQKSLSPPPPAEREREREVTEPTKKEKAKQQVELPEQMVPLEHYYYGSIAGRTNIDSISVNIKCVMCKLQFTNNIQLMAHLFSHAHNSGHAQCKYCLAGVSTEDGLEKHVQLNHPATTKCGSQFACIICEFKFATTYALGKHMSLEHLPSELPYMCGTCTFRCSSHKQAIDHFYDKHDGANTIQCPFCLKSTTIASSGRMITQNLNFFLQHLQKHQKKSVAKKCNKCALWFVQKDALKDHAKMHETQRRKAGFQPWRLDAQSINVPKSSNEEPIEEEDVDLSKLLIHVANNLRCKECGVQISSGGHFPSVLSCENENCQYVTCCSQAMMNHSSDCKDYGVNLPPLDLPRTMYCVCSYSSSDGNRMAKHLSVCERKSAYPSLDVAKSATVTHSMLDVLGLVRRPEEPTPDVCEIIESDDDIPLKDLKSPRAAKADEDAPPASKEEPSTAEDTDKKKRVTFDFDSLKDDDDDVEMETQKINDDIAGLIADTEADTEATKADEEEEAPKLDEEEDKTAAETPEEQEDTSHAEPAKDTELNDDEINNADDDANSVEAAQEDTTETNEALSGVEGEGIDLPNEPQPQLQEEEDEEPQNDQNGVDLDEQTTNGLLDDVAHASPSVHAQEMETHAPVEEEAVDHDMLDSYAPVNAEEETKVAPPPPQSDFATAAGENIQLGDENMDCA